MDNSSRNMAIFDGICSITFLALGAYAMVTMRDAHVRPDAIGWVMIPFSALLAAVYGFGAGGQLMKHMIRKHGLSEQ